MFEEIIPTIVDILIAEKRAMTTEELIDTSDFESAHLTRALNILKDLGLVNKTTNKNNVTVYQLIKELKGIHLAKAAQIGIDLSSFDGHFIINPKERTLALELATQAEKIKMLDVNKRKPLLQKRSYLNIKKVDDVTENLVLLLEASSASLHEYLEKLSEKDAYLQLLLTMHDQAEKSLQDYSNNLK
jgi:Fe2+ or Zn2+ uptake regulation protein